MRIILKIQCKAISMTRFPLNAVILCITKKITHVNNTFNILVWYETKNRIHSQEILNKDSETYSTLKIMSVGSWHQDIAIGDFYEPKLQELLLCGRYKSRYNT